MASKREKFLFWLVDNSTKIWLWLPSAFIASALASSGIGLLAALGLTLWGTVCFAVGVKIALDASVTEIKEFKDKEKKNDTTH